MENETKTDQPTPKSPKKKILFLMGILIGILLGVILTMLIVNWLENRQPKEIQIINPTQSPSRTDTVVKYVIHKHESFGLTGGGYSVPDSIATDTNYQVDESENLLLDDEDQFALEQEEEENAVPTEHMIAKSFVKAIYWDNNRNVVPAPENSPEHFLLQQWETPIKNKISYHFAGNTIQVKGTSTAQFRVIHYKGGFYLVSSKHAYPIHHNSQYEKLTEAKEFPL
ncbi:MAG: hypothetical protein MJZ57_02040 [Bacteroidales bacterium]|nr:hypothetical protein [Bacteroidales bacterium]